MFRKWILAPHVLSYNDGTGDTMSDFLTFLNTADLETLTNVPGISRPLAGNIIAARPFDFVEDALHVKGMGKNLLGRMQSYFEAEINAKENRSMIPVAEEPVALQKNPPQVESAPKAEGSSFWTRLGRASINILRAFLKFVLTVALIVGIGAALYYGLPYLEQRFVAPVQQNSARIDELASEIEALSEQVTSLQSRLEAANGRVDTIEKTIEAHSASLTRLDELRTELEREMKDGHDALALKVERELMLTRAIEYLSRARLYLSQSNFGLARDDVQATRDLLAELLIGAPDFQQDAYEQILSRLDMALGNLPSFPVIAVDDVDIAWQLLVNGLPQSAEEAAARPTATVELTVSPTVTSETTPTVTPTP
jgi:cell division protein FtsB